MKTEVNTGDAPANVSLKRDDLSVEQTLSVPAHLYVQDAVKVNATAQRPGASYQPGASR
jgi:hypothetical protein